MTYELYPFKQKNVTSYLLIADPRTIIKYCCYKNKGELQDNQRPWSEKRVIEIRDYVNGKIKLSEFDEDCEKEQVTAKGFIPNCPLLNLKKSCINESDGKVILELPEKEEPIFDILDGQHRLIAFCEEYNGLPNDEKYEMGFVLFNNLTDLSKKEMFLIPNMTQKSMDKDVIIKMMRDMGLMSDDDARIYDILTRINKESPYEGRIEFGGEKIKNGLTTKTLMNALRKVKILDEKMKGNYTKQADFLIVYFQSWNEVFPEMTDKKQHVLKKAAGFRYMVLLVNTIYKVCSDKKVHWKKEDIVPIIKAIRVGIIDDEKTFSPKSDGGRNFGGDSATDVVVSDHKEKIEALFKEDEVFDPLG